MRFHLQALAARSIRGKIFFICGILVAPMVALSIATTAMVLRISSDADRLQQETIPNIEDYEALRTAGLRVIETTNTYALINTFGQAHGQTENSFSVDKKVEMMTARDEFTRAKENLDRRPVGVSGARTRRNVDFAYQDVLKQSDKIVKMVARQSAPNIILSARERFENSAVNFRNLIDMAVKVEKAELADRQELLRRSMVLTLAIAIGIGSVGTLLGFVGGNLLSRRLARPIHQLRDAALRVGAGEFDALRNSVLQQRCDRDEISDLVQSFGKMSDRLQQMIQDHGRGERLAMLGQVAATVSHELRNPLAAIRNSIFMVRQSAAGKEPANQRAFDRVERNIDRCTRIISDMLEYTRDKVLNRTPVALDRWLVEFLGEHATLGDVPIEIDVRDAAVVEVDADRLRQVLVNLVDNAVQAVTDKQWQPKDGRQPRIILRVETIEQWVVLSVIDNGPGIPEDKLPKIFEPLFTTKSFGVGLGLPTARQLVERHGGTIDVISNAGKGATFTIRLPRAGGSSEAKAA